MSQAGRSRIELKPTQTFGELKEELGKRLNIEVKKLKICRDQAYR